MKNQKKYEIIWKLLRPLVYLICKIKFNYECEKYESDTPLLIVPNHVTNWDPLLVGSSFTKGATYFVASEHIFRWGWLSKLLIWLLAPIPRRKGSSAIDTVMTCVRRIKKGGNICIFGEGEGNWNGVTNKVIPATGKLAKLSGATLVTYRIEGAYFSQPRWGKGTKRGKIYGRIVNTYSPEVLKTMTPEEIEDIINSDIYEDAWEKQRTDQIVYKGKNIAEGLQTALFMCPECKEMNTLSTEGNEIKCTCGYKAELTHTGFFKEKAPFETIYEWDTWQFDQLQNKDLFQNKEVYFSDNNIQLSVVAANHEESILTTGELVQYKDKLKIGNYEFNLTDITEMSLVRVHILLFTYNNEYYELRSDKDTCMRKYLAIWQNNK